LIDFKGDLNQHPLIDVTFDGADEIDSMRNLIKGGGGCHLQEKLIAVSSKELIIVADARKSSTHLGQNWKRGVPVEVILNGLVYVTSELKKIGGKCTIREGSGKAGPVISENGNILVDCDFGIIFDVEGLGKKLDSIVGLVEHGLFSGMADRVYFGSEDGSTTVI
jgi:ribose 5-phosphate isomerase A